MAETELREHIRLDGAEVAESKLGRLAGAAGRVANAFSGLSNIAGALGGIGAAWKLAEGIHEAHKLHGAVARIAQVNNIAAAEAHGLFDVFEKSGIELEAAENVMMSMARMAGRIGGSIAVSGEEAGKLKEMMSALGVNAKSGIVEQMVQMSRAAQKGKIGLQDLSAVFGVGRTQAHHMLLLLQKGPESIRAIMSETAKGAGVVDDAAIAHFEKMKKARIELQQAWGDVVNIIYKAAAPAVTAVLSSIKHLMEGIAPIAERIGSILTDHMGTVVGLTKVWVGLMGANKIANMFAGEGGGKDLLGKDGRIAQVAGIASGALANTKFGRAKSMDYFEAAATFPGAGMFQAAGGPLRILSSSIGRIGVLGLALGVIAKAFHAIWTNADGVRDRLGASFKAIWDGVSKFVAAFKPVIDALARIVGGVITVAAKALLWIFERVFEAVSGIAALLGWIADKIDFVFAAVKTPVYKDGKWVMPGSNADQARKAADDAARGAGTGKGTTINQDFRGSKFEIENNFPSDVDGGRVAVAFGDELAALGERRLDSGLRPLYSYR